MTVPKYTDPHKNELKVIAAPGETALHAIQGEEVLTHIPAQEDSVMGRADVFSITFTYKGRHHHTKVIKTGTGEQDTFYKVVLNSHMCDNGGVCWLQNQPEGWITLLGKKADEALITAITAAIERRA